MATFNFRNADWHIPANMDGAQLAVLMDIRGELQTLNRLLACPNFLAIPSRLSDIERNTRKPRKKRRVTKRGAE